MTNFRKRLQDAARLFADRSSIVLWAIDKMWSRLRALGVVRPMRGAVKVRPRGFIHPVLVRLGTTDMLVLEEILLKREYTLIDPFVHGRERTIIDLGANIGLTSCMFAQRCRRASIIAVEPDFGNASLCARNLARFGARYKVINAFIGAKNGSASIDRSCGEWAFKKADNCDSDDAVPVIDMHTLLGDPFLRGRRVVDILKIDVEGTEAEIWPQCAEWLGSCKLVILETHRPAYSAEQAIEVLRLSGVPLKTRAVRRKDSQAIIVFSREKE